MTGVCCVPAVRCVLHDDRCALYAQVWIVGAALQHSMPGVSQSGYSASCRRGAAAEARSASTMGE